MFLGASVVAALAFAGNVVAAPNDLPSQCLQLSTTKALNSKTILADLGLVRDQILELRSRLVTFSSVRGFEGLNGVGLTRDQRREIQRRIAVQVTAMNAHPLGWPCQPFRNEARVVAWIRDDLISLTASGRT